MEPLFLTIREAAAALSVSRSRVYELVNSGDLTIVHVGGAKTTRIRRAEVEQYAENLPASIRHTREPV